uniref:Uncharacterized protein n=1 Tax=Kalanchoe fedtschenkoi TaxID=63787 RepID=A0A7N0U6C9_KALFE
MSARKSLSLPRIHSIPHTIISNLRIPNNPSPQFLPKSRPSIDATNQIKSCFTSGETHRARLLFDEMTERDVVAWTAMIAGYASCNQYGNAWLVFGEMLREGFEGVKPNAYTISAVLKACKGMGNAACGNLVHGLGLKHALIGDVYVDNALLGFYATCCDNMDEACLMFQQIPDKSAVSWTTLITGYAHRGNSHGALTAFREMLLEDCGVSPFSYSIAVRACASTHSLVLGKQLHAAVIKHEFASNLPLMNSLLDMYCRCGCLPDANQYFTEMGERDLITWNTLIAGYERSDSSVSLCLFAQMEAEEYKSNCFTFATVMAACGNLAVLIYGQQVHSMIIQRGFGANLAVSNSLTDMYAKCGSIGDSRSIFNEMFHRDLQSWTSMIVGYGSHGYGKEAMKLFDEMVELGIKPDQIAFMAILGACSHAGLVNEGLKYFELVSKYNITPNQEIYGCMVDLLGRAGRVHEAGELIKKMPFEPDESVWGALLGACKAHKMVDLGKTVALKVLNLKPNMVGTYATLSNIYAAEGSWAESATMRKLMKGFHSKREAGRSWVEVRDEVFSFSAGDRMCSDTDEVYTILESLAQHITDAALVIDE